MAQHDDNGRRGTGRQMQQDVEGGQHGRGRGGEAYHRSAGGNEGDWRTDNQRGGYGDEQQGGYPGGPSYSHGYTSGQQGDYPERYGRRHPAQAWGGGYQGEMGGRGVGSGPRGNYEDQGYLRGGSNQGWQGQGGYQGGGMQDFGQDGYGRGYAGQQHYPHQGYQGGRDGRGGHGEHFDPDYRQWRDEQMHALDEDYCSWRDDRYKKFSDEFSQWRNQRENQGGNKGAAASSSSQGGASSGKDDK